MGGGGRAPSLHDWQGGEHQRAGRESPPGERGCLGEKEDGDKEELGTSATGAGRWR